MESDSREFFRYHAGKGSLLSSYEMETGLLWMWAGLSCLLSSGDGYVGELLELQQGCEGLWKFQSISVISLETPQRKSAHLSWKGQPPGFSQVAAGALDL